MPDGVHYFSPLRWLLAIMLELEKRTGSSELSRIEFAFWGHTTNPAIAWKKWLTTFLICESVELQLRRSARLTKKEIAKRGEITTKSQIISWITAI